MDGIIIFAIFLLINYSINFYFSIKGLEAIRQFDYKKDKEIIEEMGIKNMDDIAMK
jgi:hypothetical protein